MHSCSDSYLPQWALQARVRSLKGILYAAAQIIEIIKHASAGVEPPTDTLALAEI